MHDNIAVTFPPMWEELILAMRAFKRYDKFTYGLKFAAYRADHPEKAGAENKDVTKFWLWINYEL